MSLRYKKLFSLEHRLHASLAPVLIESGALLLDQESGTQLCQLCFRNIQDRPVKALRAVVQMLDEEGKALGKLVDHRYQDLDLKREGLCGRDLAIVLPTSQAASFKAWVSQVTFDDGEVWAEDKPWEPLPEQFTLEDHFDEDAEVLRYRRRFGSDSTFFPVETEDLWFCTCGAVNANTEGRCHSCRRRRSALLGKGPELPQQEDPEEDSFEDAALLPEKVPFQLRRLAIGAAALVLLVILALVLIPRLRGGSTKAEQPETPPVEASEDSGSTALQDAYEKALALQSQAETAAPESSKALYLSAAEAFEVLGKYQDSESRTLQCRKAREALLQEEYAAAQALLEQERYSEAREEFLALGDYQDSADLANEALYQKALGLFRYMEEHSVRGITASLSADPDTESLVAISREQQLRLGQDGLRELESRFGADPVLFTAAEEDSSLPPLQDALLSLLEPLGDYKDSRELAAQLPEMIDQSDTFFALCEAGELEAARDWLEAWDKPFEDRDLWLQRIEHYLPINGCWDFSNGDPSLVAYMAGGYGKIYTVWCRVSLSRKSAVLCFLLSEGDETGPELTADLDGDCFRLDGDYVGYLAQMNSSFSLSLNKTEEGNITGGAEFTRHIGP